MKKWTVYLSFNATKVVEDIEAETQEEAIEKAIDRDGYASLCHQCSSEIELGDVIPEESSAEEDDA